MFRRRLRPALVGGTAIAALAALITTIPSGPASGFAEDVCPAQGGGWTSCPAVTKLVPLPGSEGARSTIHTDSTYLLAQAVGFSPHEALTLATYDDAVDIGQYVHRDRNGTVDPSVTTADLTGLARSNFTGGGIFLHFMAPVTGPAPEVNQPAVAQHQAAAGAPLRHVDGMRPDPTDPFVEPLLANARRWAYGRGPLCVAGLTERSPRGDYATGQHCYHRPDGSTASMLTSLPVSNPDAGVVELDFMTPLGQLQLTSPGDDHPVPASRIARLTGRRDAPLARLGIYIHALQDRVSHHRCIDASYAVGPRPASSPPVVVSPLGILASGAATQPTPQVGGSPTLADPDFLTTFASGICDQIHHSQLHQQETGTDQSALDPIDRTLGAGLRAAARELRAFAGSAYGRRVLGQVGPVRLRGLVPALVRAESVADPAARLDALTAVATRHDLAPMPGY